MLRRERTECAGSTLAPPQRKKSNVYEDMRTWSVFCSIYWQLHICHDSNAEIIKLPFGKRDGFWEANCRLQTKATWSPHEGQTPVIFREETTVTGWDLQEKQCPQAVSEVWNSQPESQREAHSKSCQLAKKPHVAPREGSENNASCSGLNGDPKIHLCPNVWNWWLWPYLEKGSLPMELYYKSWEEIILGYPGR